MMKQSPPFSLNLSGVFIVDDLISQVAAQTVWSDEIPHRALYHQRPV